MECLWGKSRFREASASPGSGRTGLAAGALDGGCGTLTLEAGGAMRARVVAAD